jgi:TolB-like protein/lipoprotein NlpI
MIAGSIGIIIVTLLGMAGYFYYGRTNADQISSIAVMPFVNDSGNSDADYLSDGMTETLISSLSQLKNLNVKPRSMGFRYKGRDIDLQTIGKELGVEAILNGRLVPRGGDISLFVELIDVASTKVVWSRQYNRKEADLVALQNDIARDVSSTLKNGLSSDEERKVIQTGTNDPEAYRLYLLARSLSERRKEREALKAVEYYEQAIALDPNYAAAYGGLARAHTFTALYGSVPFNEAMAKARAAQLRVLELTPDSPEAHIGLGATMLLVRDFAGSEREVNRALELNHDLHEAHRQNGLRLSYLGRLDQALAEFKRTIDLDSTATTAKINYAWCLFYSGRDAESEAVLKAVQEIDPSVWFAEFQLFNNSRRKNDFTAAAEHLAHAQELRDEPEAAKFIRDSFRTHGWNGMMRAALEHPEKAKIWEYYLATFAAELGDKDRAFALLDRSADKYDQFIMFAKIDPAMKSLRGDPRYGELLGRLGLK